jgi:hypothetical protein
MRGDLHSNFTFDIPEDEFTIPAHGVSFLWTAFLEQPLRAGDREEAYQRWVFHLIKDVSASLRLHLHVEQTLNVNGDIADIYFFTLAGRLIGSLEVKRRSKKEESEEKSRSSKSDADLVVHPKVLGQLTRYMVEVLLMGGLRHSFALVSTYQSTVLCWLQGSLGDNGDLGPGVDEQALNSMTPRKTSKDNKGVVTVEDEGSWGDLKMEHSRVVDLQEEGSNPGRNVAALVGTALRLMLLGAKKPWAEDPLRSSSRPVITDKPGGASVTASFNPDNSTPTLKLPHNNTKIYHRIAQLGRGLHGQVWKVAPKRNSGHLYAAKYFHLREGETEEERNARAAKEELYWNKVNPKLESRLTQLCTLPVLLMPLLTMLVRKPSEATELDEVEALLRRCAHEGIQHTDLLNKWGHVGYFETPNKEKLFALVDFGHVNSVEKNSEEALATMMQGLGLN